MVTASIVIHNTPTNQLEKALSCLLANEIDKVFVIDNSPNENLDYISKLQGKDRLEYLHVENRGFGAGHNIAIKEAIELKADFHLVMNADVFWDKSINLIDELKNFMETNPKTGLVSPKVYYPDGDLQYTCRKLPTPLDLMLKRFIPQSMFKRKRNEYLLANHNHNFLLNSPYILGSFMFFRVAALKECGIFDERFFMYPEDIDITRRLHKKWETIYYPSVSIIHEHQAASRKNLKMFGIHLKNMVRYFNKWGWFIDKERKEYNKKLLNNLVILKPGEVQKGRG